MSYQVLARKWRPQAFSDVVGQEHVLTALANGLSLGRIHHAYLFSGTRGVGKTTIARLLAKGLNCEKGITVSPCGHCENCREIEQGRFVDLIEIDAASRTKVEDTRELLDNVQYAPARGRFKVYLIDEVHMLSRHSFNALLKTLEEPPAHVKFLLATTDPQKLPVTILSRCLQFHLKALDVTQIRGQLEHILQAEQISAEPRALQLIARAADGSMRDALSLTDQAIAMGQGQITTNTVSTMLGTLNDDQPLALIEALANADGQQVMSLLNQVAARGIEWDALLVELLRLLHQVAMVQLLPSALGDDYALYEQRLRELARSIPPDDIQLYYQMLLVGRKELPLAPDPRMGVEMTLLRTLAFHPRDVITLPEQARTPPVSAAAAASVVLPDATPVVETEKKEISPPAASVLPDTTSHLLQARTKLRQQGESKVKKSEPAKPAERPVNRVLERFAAVSEKKSLPAARPAVAPVKKEAYRWKAQQAEQKMVAPVATPNALRLALEYEKTPELAAKLADEAKLRDGWAAEIDQLRLPRLVQQLALNAWKETTGDGICLHLRSAQRHLNSSSAQASLQDALSNMAGTSVALTVTEDDDPSVLTPLEWRQKIYHEKLAQARQSILADTRIQTLRQYFDAELDEESIRPV